MDKEETLWKLEGLQTLETVSEKLGIKKQSALNLLSKLKKEGYVVTEGGGKQPRFYHIYMRKIRPRSPGMFDIINKYSPKMKLSPWYDHQVHGRYGPEEALVDAVQTESFRVILASMRLFNHIKDWPRLYRLAKKEDCWQKIGALYDVARMFIRVRKMPRNYGPEKYFGWRKMTQLMKKNFPEISHKWKIYIPFNQNDMVEI